MAEPLRKMTLAALSKTKAVVAQTAAKAIDRAKLFAVIKKLFSKPFKRIPGVNLKDGTFATTPPASRQRRPQFSTDRLEGVNNENHRHTRKDDEETERSVC